MVKLSMKIEPIDKDIELFFKEEMSPAARSAFFAQYAREQLTVAEQEDKAKIGHVPPHKTFVDGSEGASEDTVKPEGVIVYEFELFEDMFAWIADQLELHSPVRSGTYQKSHAFYADGEELDAKGLVPPAQQYVFVNTQPYARKIERGQSPQFPDGVYEVVALLAQRRFSNLARVRFGYQTPVGGGTALEQWASTTRVKSRGRRYGQRSYGEWVRRQPAITITPR